MGCKAAFKPNLVRWWCGGGAVVGVSLAKHSRTRFVTSGWVYRFVRVCVRLLKDWQLQCDVGYKLKRSQLLWHGQLHFFGPRFWWEKKQPTAAKTDGPYWKRRKNLCFRWVWSECSLTASLRSDSTQRGCRCSST